MSLPNITLNEAQLKAIFNSLRTGTKINNASDTHKHFRALALRHTFETNGFRKLPNDNAESFIAKYNGDLWSVTTLEDRVDTANSQFEVRKYFNALSKIQPKDELLAKVVKKENASKRENLLTRAVGVLKRKF